MYGQDSQDGKLQNTTMKKKLTAEEKAQEAETLLEAAIFAKHNCFPFAQIDAVYKQAIDLAPKKSPLAASIHVHYCIALKAEAKSLATEVPGNPKLSAKLYKLADKESKASLAKAKKADPDNLLCLYHSEMQKLKGIKKPEKKEAERKKFMTKLLTMDPVTFDDHEALYMADYWVNGIETALARLESLKLKPQFKSDYVLHTFIAQAYRDQVGDLVKAEEAFREAIKSNPKYASGLSALSHILDLQADMLLKAGQGAEANAKREDAIVLAKKGFDLRQQEGFPMNLHTIGSISRPLSMLDRYEEMLEYSRMEVEVAGETYSTCVSMDVALSGIKYLSDEAREKGLTEALSYVDKGLAMVPNDILLLAARVNDLGALGRIEEALDCANALYAMMRKSKASQEQFDALEEHHQAFVDNMLTGKKQELMAILNGEPLETVPDLEASANPATKMLLKQLQEEEATLKAEKAGIVQEAFRVKGPTTDESALLAKGKELQRHEGEYNQRAKATKLSTAELEAEVEALMREDDAAYEFFTAYTVIVYGMHEVACGAITGRIKLEAKNPAGTLAELAGFLPMGGEQVKSIIQLVAGRAVSHTLNPKLSKLASVADPVTFHKILTKVALGVAHDKRDAIASCTPEVNGVVMKYLKKAVKFFKAECKDTFLDTPEKKLAAVEAGKFLKAVYNEDVSVQPRDTFAERVVKFVSEHSVADQEHNVVAMIDGYMASTLGSVCDSLESAMT